MNAKHSVVQVCNFSPSHAGAFATALCALAKELQRRGLRQVVVLPEDARERPWVQDFRRDMTVRFLPSEGRAEKHAGQLARLIRKERGLLVNTHYIRHDVAAWLACTWLRVACRLPVELVWAARSTPAVKYTLIGWAKRQAKYRLLGRSVHLLAVSAGVRDRVVSLGFPSGRTHVVPNGINPRRATRQSATPEATRDELNIPAGAVVALGFARDVRLKGGDLMIEALRLLVAEAKCNVYFVIVGGEEVGRYAAERLEPEAQKRLRVAPSRPDPADYYGIADVFVSASRREGFSYALAESMANCLPVVVSDLDTMSWVRPVGGARFFASGDARALARSLHAVVDASPQERTRLGRTNRAFIENQHSLEGWVRDMLRVYSRAQPALQSLRNA